MKNFWKWLLLFVGVFLAAFVVALPIWRFATYGFRVAPMMRGGRLGVGPHMARGFGFPGMGWMFPGAWIIPVAIFVLLVIGIIALVRSMRRPHAMQASVGSIPPVVPAAPVESATHNCANCGKPLQAEWTNCPYCGVKI